MQEFEEWIDFTRAHILRCWKVGDGGRREVRKRISNGEKPSEIAKEIKPNGNRYLFFYTKMRDFFSDTIDDMLHMPPKDFQDYLKAMDYLLYEIE